MDDLAAFYAARLDEAEAALTSEATSETMASAFMEWARRADLLDRITEEQCAGFVQAFGWGYLTGRGDKERARRDIAAKRAILAEHGDQHECTDLEATRHPYTGCRTARLLVAEFSDHPGYKPEWEPGLPAN